MASLHLPLKLTDLADSIKFTTTTLRSIKDEFDLIVFSGYSGALIAPTAALRVKKPMGFVRKPGEASHGVPIEITDESCGNGRYVIVDDFISTGETVKRLIKSLTDWNCKMRCVGIVLATSTFDPYTFYRQPKHHRGFAWDEGASYFRDATNMKAGDIPVYQRPSKSSF
jgi:adenine/guanine phosphoribosyltransferase-like PRPP-binding protein